MALDAMFYLQLIAIKSLHLLCWFSHCFCTW